MELKNSKHGKGMEGQGAAGHDVPSPKGMSPFSRFVVYAATISTVAGGMNLNPLWQNNAMAQPRTKPAPQAAPAETSVEDIMRKKAETAAQALQSFFTSGDAKNRQLFLKLWNESGTDNVFFNRMVEVIQSSYPTLSNAIGSAINRKLELIDKTKSETIELVAAAARDYQIKGSTAADALKAFIITGNALNKDQFLKLWNANSENDLFFSRMMDVIQSNYLSLFKAIQSALNNGPAVADKTKGPSFTLVMDAIQAYYDYMAKPEAERDRAALIASYGEQFATSMDNMRKRTSVPVRSSEEQAYTYFVKIFRVDIQADASLQTKANAVRDAVRDWFGIKDDISASAVTRALVIAYSTIDNEDDRRRFGVWLNDMKENARPGFAAMIAAAQKTRSQILPYELVINQFKQYKVERAELVDKARIEQAALRRFPIFIREHSLDQIAQGFVSQPTDLGADNMGLRIAYLAKKKEALLKGDAPDKRAQIEAIDKEVAGFKSWLAIMGIKEDDPMQGQTKLRARLIIMQSLYYTVDPAKPGILDFLAGQSTNPLLYGILKAYMLEVDKSSINMFKGMNVSDPEFLTTARRKMNEKINMQLVAQGRYIWQQDYFSKLAASPGTDASQPTAPATTPTSWTQAKNQQVFVDPQLLMYVADLDPMMAAAFMDYQKTAQGNGLVSNQEKKLVVATVAKLYAMSPMLISKYFSAITNLANVCEDNSEAFIQALTVIGARIDAVSSSQMDPTSPMRLLPLNFRQVILRLSDALEDIAKIPKADLSRYDRLNLLDSSVLVNQNPPHSIEQRPAAYAPKLLVDDRQASALYPPYPFPNYMLTPTPSSMFNFGGVVNSPMAYDGRVQLPMFQPLRLQSGAGMVGAAGRSYFYPQHSLVTVNSYLPGTNISGLSPTRLMNDINRAFVPKRQLDYSATPLGGGGGAGFLANKPGDQWQYAGGGLASLITPTGGAALGGSIQGSEILAGSTAVAMPVGQVNYLPRTTPGVGPVTEGEIGIDSALAGYQKTLDANDSRLIARAISSQWDPKNPSQLLLMVDSTTDVNGMKVMTARYYFVDKDGTIFELKGGQNDFVSTLNFVAGSANQQFNTPTTYFWNAEPTVQRGGGVMVVDLGKTNSAMGHVQAVPFLLSQDTRMPFLLEWTPGFAHTFGDSTAQGATVGQITLPGKLLIVQTPASTTTPTPGVVPGTTAPYTGPLNPPDKYFLQDIDFMIRRVKGKEALQVDVGAGLGTAPTGITGRGGIFIKTQKPENERAGGGIFYEGGAVNMEAIAILQDSQEAQQYIQSLHRIGATIYGSTMTADRLMLGGLAHVMPQFETPAGGSARYDATFWRMVGVLKGLTSGARIDVSRVDMLDQMMADYQTLQATVGNDPANAATYISQFQSQYQATIKQVVDKYNLQIQVRKDFSIDGTLTAREDESMNWVKQVPDTAYARLLYTWDTGFTRAFAMVPVLSTLTSYDATHPVPSIGVAGVGAGTDLLDSIFLPRAAMDVGVLLARYQADNPQDIVAWQLYGKMPKSGFFVQGGVVLFSNIVEDSKRYRVLMNRYDTHRMNIEAGLFNKLPDEVRKQILEGIDTDRFDSGTLDALKRGDQIKLKPGQTEDLLNSLYNNWFYGQKADIQKDFNGHMRSFLSGSGYFFGDRTYWDVGVYFEFVDKFKGYIIAAGRGDTTIYGGADFTQGRIRASAMVGASTLGNIGGAASLGYKFGPLEFPMEAGLYGYGRSATVPDYAAPYYMAPQRTGIPEIGVLFYLTLLGGGGPPMVPNVPYTTPGPSTFGR